MNRSTAATWASAPECARARTTDVWDNPSLTVTGVQVEEGQDAKVEIPAPGSLVLQAATSGYAVVMEAQSSNPFCNLTRQTWPACTRCNLATTPWSSGSQARGTLYSIQKNFKVASGNTTTIKLHG